MRHRHKTHHYINDDLKEVIEDTQFKLIISLPSEMDKWKQWVKDRGGEYKYNKELSKQEGELPDVKDIFGDEEFCWCDTMTYWLLHVAGYRLDMLITNPYKGEVYRKD